MVFGNSGSFTISGTKYMSAVCCRSESYDFSTNQHNVSIDQVSLVSTKGK